jgi:hypothetical protein
MPSRWDRREERVSQRVVERVDGEVEPGRRRGEGKSPIHSTIRTDHSTTVTKFHFWEHFHNGDTTMTSEEKMADVNKWLATRKEAGLEIDPKTAEVFWTYAQTLDPYGVDPDLPEEYQQVRRAYFARAPGSDVWVWFATCPKRPGMPCGTNIRQSWHFRQVCRLRKSLVGNWSSRRPLTPR